MNSVGIFSPIYHRNKEVQKFLINLLYSNFSNHDTYLCLGINGADNNLRYFISSYAEAVSDRFKKILIIDPEENVGKPAIVNTMVKSLEEQIGKEVDYIVSMDSDLVTVDFNWLNKFQIVFDNYAETPVLGALCANQSGENCHILNVDPMVCNVGDYHIVTRAGNEGIAGGVLMTPNKIWKELGGYSAHRLYASDDGHYALACANKRYLMGMVQEVTFYHPHANNPEYSSWKHRATSDTLSEEEKKGFKF